MALKDLIKELGGVFSRVRGDNTRRPDGGTSHYSPIQKRAETRRRDSRPRRICNTSILDSRG